MSMTFKMSEEDVLAAILSERRYQLLKYGIADPPGSNNLQHAKYDGYDCLCYIQSYISLAMKLEREKINKLNINSPSIVELRKVACLIYGYLEDQFSDREDARVHIRLYALKSKTKGPEDACGISWYLLYIQRLINQSLLSVAPEANISNENFIRMLSCCFECFERFGVPERDNCSNKKRFSFGIINGVYNVRDITSRFYNQDGVIEASF